MPATVIVLEIVVRTLVKTVVLDWSLITWNLNGNQNGICCNQW